MFKLINGEKSVKKNLKMSLTNAWCAVSVLDIIK